MPTLMSMPCPHVHYSSSMLLPQGQHAVYMCPDIISLISIDHACTMCTLWGTHVPWRHPNPRLSLDSSSPMTSCHVTSKSCALSLSRHRLIIILLLYLNPNLTKVCPHFCLITLPWLLVILRYQGRDIYRVILALARTSEVEWIFWSTLEEVWEHRWG